MVKSSASKAQLDRAEAMFHFLASPSSLLSCLLGCFVCRACAKARRPKRRPRGPEAFSKAPGCSKSCAEERTCLSGNWTVGQAHDSGLRASSLLFCYCLFVLLFVFVFFWGGAGGECTSKSLNVRIHHNTNRI